METNNYCHVRFDFLFLPGADNVACIRHYRGEKHFRKYGDLALVPTYGATERFNKLIVLDQRDYEAEGALFVDFDRGVEGDREPHAEVTEHFGWQVERLRTRMDPYTRSAYWLGDEMDELYRLSRIREEMEEEYLLMMELMEA